MEKFDCDCILGEMDLDDILHDSRHRLFLLNTDPLSSLVTDYPFYGCPVCKPERKGPAAPWPESEKVKRMKRPLDSKDAAVLKLFVDDDRARLRLDHKSYDCDVNIQWTLTPDGAYLPCEYGWKPSNLVMGMRNLAIVMGLEPTLPSSLPQTDQPVLFVSSIGGGPCLFFRGHFFQLCDGGPAVLLGNKVDLATLLYEAATDMPPDEKPSAIVLELFVDDDGRVCLQWQKNGMDGLWVLRSDGAYLPGSNITSDLVRGLLLLTDTLKPTAVANLPQTDQPVLYIDARCGVPGLRFEDTTFSLGADGKALWAGGDADMVSILYKAARRDAPPDEKPGVIVLDLFENNHDEVVLLLRHNRQVVVWVLRPDGAYDAGQDCGPPVNLAAALRDYARELGEISAASMPSDDKLFLYKKSNMEVLRFRGNNYVLGDSSTYGGDTVDLVALLYEAATADPPDEQGGLVMPQPFAARILAEAHGSLTLATISRPIRVVWNDAAPYHGWHNLGDGDRLPLETNETMGYLVGETPAAIVVARSVSAHKVGDLLVIPRTTIVKMETMN